MKTQIVYKILQKHNKKLFSCAGNTSERKDLQFTLRYFTNKVNKPRSNQNPFLFCFNTLRAAQEIIGRLEPGLIIYEAIATNVKDVVRVGKRKVHHHWFYTGTRFASSLKLTKRIPSQ